MRAGAPIAEEKIAFISPSVDEKTQTVLVKTPVTVPGNLRTDQYVRAQVIWSSDPGLTIPVTSVNRINGQWFAFVAEPGEGGKGLVARQRAVQLGPVVNNNYTVVGGLKPGEKLIASGIQKIRDGAPVRLARGKRDYRRLHQAAGPRDGLLRPRLRLPARSRFRRCPSAAIRSWRRRPSPSARSTPAPTRRRWKAPSRPRSRR